jgi:hypothetical protein
VLSWMLLRWGEHLCWPLSHTDGSKQCTRQRLMVQQRRSGGSPAVAGLLPHVVSLALTAGWLLPPQPRPPPPRQTSLPLVFSRYSTRPNFEIPQGSSQVYQTHQTHRLQLMCARSVCFWGDTVRSRAHTHTHAHTQLPSSLPCLLSSTMTRFHEGLSVMAALMAVTSGNMYDVIEKHKVPPADCECLRACCTAHPPRMQHLLPALRCLLATVQ